MKKINIYSTILITSVFAFISCSDDSIDYKSSNYSTTVSDSSYNVVYGDHPDLEKTYLQIIASDEYQNFKESINIFASKFNLFPVDLNNKEELFNWIENNLGGTTFSGIYEANSLYGKIESDFGVLININHSFYSKLFFLTDEEREHILHLGKMDPFLFYLNNVEYSGPCEFECYNTAWDCSGTVDQKYEEQMDAAALAFRNGYLSVAAAIATYAQTQQILGQHRCRVDFDNCYDNCYNQ